MDAGDQRWSSVWPRWARRKTVNGKHSLDRKTLVMALGTAGLGLGLGLIATPAGFASNATAQEAATPALAQEESVPEEGGVQSQMRPGEMREELYRNV
jgi:hypothetical protein